MFFGKNKETQVIDLMRGHLELVNECMKLFKQFISAYCEGADIEALKAMSYNLHKKEHDADEAEKEIQRQIISGAFLPFYRENFITIPEMVDKIAGYTVVISQEIILNPIPIPEKLKQYFLDLLEGVCNTYEQFLEIFKYVPGDFNKVVEICEKVALAESKVDGIEWKGKVFLYGETDLGLSKFDRHFFKDLFVYIGGIADRIENTADYIELTMIKMKV
ncbi:DUF47 family protein [bacterium]|nr:DUF47 family protein [bacterium]